MARIKGVSSAQAGLQMYALVPVLFKGYATLEQAAARPHRRDKRLHAIAELKRETS